MSVISEAHPWSRATAARALVHSLPFLALLSSFPAAAEDSLWGRQCAKDADGRNERCVVQQYVTAQPGNRQLLLAQFRYDGSPEKPQMILVTPLGVLLTGGISLGIDGKKSLTVPFETCNTGGCLSIIDMDKAALDQFRKGNVLTVRYGLAGEQKPLDLPVKLEGLSDALKSIAP